MPRFPRLSLYLFVALPLLAVLGSCVPRNNGKTLIRYSFWGSIEQQVVEEKVVAEFEAQNPDIEVELLPIGARYAEKVQSMMIGHVAPDVIMVGMDQYMEWSDRGALADITELVGKMTANDPLMPIPDKAFRRKGKFFAFPINCSGHALFYNQDALTAAGIRPEELATWEDLWRLAPRLSRRAGTLDAPTDYAMLMPTPLIIFWGYGGELFDSREAPTQVRVNAEALRHTIDLMRAAREKGFAVPPDVSSDQGTYQLFRDGKVAIMFDGRWRTPELAGKTDFTWNVAAMPGGPAGRLTMHGGTGLAISSHSGQPEAARRFIEFYGSRKGMEIAIGGGRSVPVHREMAYGPEFLGMRPPADIRVFAETMEPGASRIVVYSPGSLSVSSIFQAAMERALSDPKRPVEQVQKSMEQELERWLRRQKEKGLL